MVEQAFLRPREELPPLSPGNREGQVGGDGATHHHGFVERADLDARSALAGPSRMPYWLTCRLITHGAPSTHPGLSYMPEINSFFRKCQHLCLTMLCM